jgi:drug/metabolite transporter (DMT)-like permease
MEAAQSAASGIAIVLLVFGSLSVWPLLRLFGHASSELEMLRLLFLANALCLAAAFCWVLYLYFSGAREWIHGLAVPYLVGALFWLAAISALIAWAIEQRALRRRTQSPARDRVA